MGSPINEEERLDNECQHTLIVSSFNIGRYEVTQADWIDIMGSSPPELYFEDCKQCPVDRISWNDIQEFLQKLNSRNPDKKYRLPTETEWEYAARGGIKNRGYIYAGGNTLDEVAWYNMNASGKTHPVGEKSPNELGLYDMSGNVREWCQDIWKPYLICSGTNNEEFRVLRGGCWYDNNPRCRIARRNSDRAEERDNGIGFRLASDSLR